MESRAFRNVGHASGNAGNTARKSGAFGLAAPWCKMAGQPPRRFSPTGPGAEPGSGPP